MVLLGQQDQKSRAAPQDRKTQTLHRKPEQRGADTLRWVSLESLWVWELTSLASTGQAAPGKVLNE